MRLLDNLDKNLIFLKLDAKDKAEAFDKIVLLMEQNKAINNAKGFLAEVWRRENLGSTGIGNGIAIPHARLKDLDKIVVVLARLKKGIDFGTEDKEPVKLIFLLGTPPEMASEYLKVLAKLSRLLKEKNIQKKLLEAASAAEVLEIIDEAESQLE